MKFINGAWLMQPGVTPFYASTIRDVHITDSAITFFAPFQPINHRGDTLTGPLLTLEISSPKEEVFKVKMTHFKQKPPLTQFELSEEKNLLKTLEHEAFYEISSGKSAIRIYKTQWLIEFYYNKRLLTYSGWRSLGMLQIGGSKYMSESLNLTVNEKIYGLGERFTNFIRNGQSIDIWNEDGGTGTEQSYKNIPFYLSTNGYGLLVNDPGKVSFEIGSEKVSKIQFSVPGNTLEYIIFPGQTPKEILKKYSSLTGLPGLPPPWSFGLWLTTSFTTNYDEKTVTEFVDGMMDRAIPLHTFHFDCFWMKEYEWCNFTWDTDVFPDPQGMLKRLKEKGLHICVWINPYIAQKSPLYDEGLENGYFIKLLDGNPWQWDLWQPGMAIVDFTNPQACQWYEGYLERLLDMGVDAFKTDFGERIPVEGVTYYNGAEPEKMHNYYAFLYNKVVYDLLERKMGKDQAVLFARSASVGSQKFPVHWGGDCTSVYESMAESLRGGLSLSLSGFGFWSHDIGGFESTSTADLYKRWIAFGLLSTHSRLHGSSSYRVPWLYDEESVEVLRFFTQLKCRLMPYLYTQAILTAHTGIPMMRAMLLEHPEDTI
jgi:alpha-D-xyloside xylohydrolase